MGVVGAWAMWLGHAHYWPAMPTRSAGLGFRLKVVAVCCRSIAAKRIPRSSRRVLEQGFSEVVAHPDVDIVAELVGGAGVAAEVLTAPSPIAKSLVTANKELMACGPGVLGSRHPRRMMWPWKPAWQARLQYTPCCARAYRGNSVSALYGILNGTCRLHPDGDGKRGDPLETVLAGRSN